MTQDQYQLKQIVVIKHKGDFTVNWEFVRQHLAKRFPLYTNDIEDEERFDVDAVRKKISLKYPTAPIRYVEDFLLSAKNLTDDIHLLCNADYSTCVKILLETLLKFSE